MAEAKSKAATLVCDKAGLGRTLLVQAVRDGKPSLTPPTNDREWLRR